MDFSRVVLRVDLARLAENFQLLRRRAEGLPLLAVVKADAYGLGALPVAKALKEAGAAKFGVATLAEARELAPLGLDIQILGALFPEETEEAVARDLIAPCPDWETGCRLNEAAGKLGKKVRVAVKADTGMGRLGFQVPELLEALRRLRTLPHLELYGLYSHFPQADEPGNDFTLRQIRTFRTLAETLAAEGITFHDVHIAASNGINRYPEALRKPFTLARAGIAMYGEPGDPELPCVFSLAARLGAVRILPAGATVGYRSLCVLPGETRVGTVAAGYADGVPLALTNRGFMGVRGKRCPVLGRVCMDYTMISLAEVPEAVCGDEVTLIGAEIPAEEWARLKGTHLHDILCAIGPRVTREYRP